MTLTTSTAWAKVIVPVTITDTMLVASSIAEDDHAAWSNAVTYVKGDRVILAHRIWESLVGGNLNHNPTTDVAAEYWGDAGPTNQRAMFDESPATPSSAPTEISVTLRPGTWVNSLALVSAVCRTARVRVYDADGTTLLYDRTQVSTTLTRSSWHGWFMRTRFVVREDFTFEDLPRRVRGTMVITLRGPGSVSVGVLAVGLLHAIGRTREKPESDQAGFSRVLIDDFGKPTIYRRGTSRTRRYSLLVANDDIPRFHALRESIDALPCIFIATGLPNLRTALLAYGLATRMPVVIEGLTHSICSLEIQGFV